MTVSGDSLSEYHNGMEFSTMDRDNDDHMIRNCAETIMGRGGTIPAGVLVSTANITLVQQFPILTVALNGVGGIEAIHTVLQQ